MAFLIVALTTGIVLGLYYNFLVLAPATLAVALIIGAPALLHGQGASSAVLAAMLPAIGLQGGYMIGLTGRNFFGQLLDRINGVQSTKRV